MSDDDTILEAIENLSEDDLAAPFLLDVTKSPSAEDSAELALIIMEAADPEATYEGVYGRKPYFRIPTAKLHARKDYSVWKLGGDWDGMLPLEFKRAVETVLLPVVNGSVLVDWGDISLLDSFGGNVIADCVARQARHNGQIAMICGSQPTAQVDFFDFIITTKGADVEHFDTEEDALPTVEAMVL